MVIFKIVGIGTSSGTERPCDAETDEFIFLLFLLTTGEVVAVSVGPKSRSGYKYQGECCDDFSHLNIVPSRITRTPVSSKENFPFEMAGGQGRRMCLGVERKRGVPLRPDICRLPPSPVRFPGNACWTLAVPFAWWNPNPFLCKEARVVKVPARGHPADGYDLRDR